MADKSRVQPLTRPLFQVDPGWLFILAGLAICAAGIILPAQGDLQALQRQLDQLRAEEVHAYARLKAHSDFMDQVDRADPALVRRLAAAQLNVVPQGDKPVMLSVSDNAPVTDWIDGTVKTDIRPSKAVAISTLSRLANGPYRLWMFGGGIMSVFVGLMLSPAPLRSRARRPQETAASEQPSLGAVAIEWKQPDDSLNDEQQGLSDQIADGDELQSVQTIIEPKDVAEYAIDDSVEHEDSHVTEPTSSEPNQDYRLEEVATIDAGGQDVESFDGASTSESLANEVANDLNSESADVSSADRAGRADHDEIEISAELPGEGNHAGAPAGDGQGDDDDHTAPFSMDA